MRLNVMSKIVNVALKAKAKSWTFEAKAIKILASRTTSPDICTSAGTAHR